MLAPPKPELDASSQEFDMRMTQGDPINFQWIVPGAAEWAGDYTWKVRIGDGVIEVEAEATVQGDDALFSIVADPVDELAPSSTGWDWALKQVDGPTRFGGLLRVEEAI